MNRLSVSSSAIRQLGLGAALCGVVLASAPDVVSRAVTGAEPPPPPWVVRILGLRQLGQGLLLVARPHPTVARLGAAVDGLHAASMAAAAWRWPEHRRAAASSGLIAAGFAVAGLRAGRRRSLTS